jgi:hypothetical protein
MKYFLEVDIQLTVYADNQLDLSFNIHEYKKLLSNQDNLDLYLRNKEELYNQNYDIQYIHKLIKRTFEESELNLKYNCYPKIINYSEYPGSIHIDFTAILFISAFINYGSIRQSIDYIINDIKSALSCDGLFSIKHASKIKRRKNKGKYPLKKVIYKVGQSLLTLGTTVILVILLLRNSSASKDNNLNFNNNDTTLIITISKDYFKKLIESEKIKENLQHSRTSLKDSILDYTKY